MNLSADQVFMPGEPPAVLAFSQRIGILGGTFNPIHTAHTQAALAVRSQFALQEVLILPSGVPPHKPAVAGAHHRLAMCHLAADGLEGVRVSDMEVLREGVTYTVDTLRALKARYLAHTVFFYIIGADTLSEIITWKESGEVVKLCEFVALYRPGVSKDMDMLREDFLAQFPEAKLHVAQFDGMNISSSDIRARIAMGLPADGLICPEVQEYIRMNGLYQSFEKELYS